MTIENNIRVEGVHQLDAKTFLLLFFLPEVVATTLKPDNVIYGREKPEQLF